MNSKTFSPFRWSVKPPSDWRHLLLIVISGLTLAGCGSGPEGPRRAAVSGIVTLDGEPMQAGVVRFIPKSGTNGPKLSVSILDGKFHLPAESGPVVGEHRVEIESSPAGALGFDDELALEQLGKAGRKSRVSVVRIPEIYNRNSLLKATISRTQNNNLVFELHSKPR